jgi:hypothetical protein
MTTTLPIMSDIPLPERMMKVETKLDNHEVVLNKLADKFDGLQKTIWMATGALLLGSFGLRLLAEFFSHK